MLLRPLDHTRQQMTDIVNYTLIPLHIQVYFAGVLCQKQLSYYNQELESTSVSGLDPVPYVVSPIWQIIAH